MIRNVQTFEKEEGEGDEARTFQMVSYDTPSGRQEMHLKHARQIATWPQIAAALDMPVEEPAAPVVADIEEDND